MKSIVVKWSRWPDDAPYLKQLRPFICWTAKQREAERFDSAAEAMATLQRELGQAMYPAGWIKFVRIVPRSA